MIAFPLLGSIVYLSILLYIIVCNCILLYITVYYSIVCISILVYIIVLEKSIEEPWPSIAQLDLIVSFNRGTPI